MASSSPLLFLFLLSLIAAPSSAAPSSTFNITQILDSFPQYFSGFNKLLLQSKLAEEINRHNNGVTILAVSDSGLGPAKSLTPEVLKRVLSVHVILGYNDITEFLSIGNDPIIHTTLFQFSGTAEKGQGFVKMSKINNNVIFGSAVSGSPQNCELIKVVYSKAPKLSVLLVSDIIVPPGIDKVSAPAPKPNPVTETVVGNAPGPAAKTVVSNAPAPKPGPATKTVVGNAPAPKPGPATKTVVGNAPAPKPNPATKTVVGNAPGPATKTVVGNAPAPKPNPTTKTVIGKKNHPKN